MGDHEKHDPIPSHHMEDGQIIIDPPKPQDEINKNRREEKDYEYKSNQIATNNRLVLLTFFLAIGTIAGTTISIWQASIASKAADIAKQAADSASEAVTHNDGQFDRTMRQIVDQTVIQFHSAKATEKSADAARKAALIADEALHISERAYLFSGSPALELSTNLVSLPLINTGHMASGKVHIIIHEATLNAESSNPMPTQHVPIEAHWQEFTENSVATSNVNGTAAFTIGIPTPGIVESQFMNGHQQIIIAGSITYNDGFPDTPSKIETFCDAGLYFISLKKVSWTPCEPEIYIAQLIQADKYPNPSTKR